MCMEYDTAPLARGYARHINPIWASCKHCMMRGRQKFLYLLITPGGIGMAVVSGYGRIAVVPKEDAELTHVRFGTPMGELLRRYWQPVCLSSEIDELPKLVTILGEELVAFRDKRGRVGVLDAHCAHRGTSLEYGRIEEEGIRCCYHGWLFSAEGVCLQQPGEPPNSRYKDKVAQPAYPALEYGGLVFAYMGPPDKKPEFPL